MIVRTAIVGASTAASGAAATGNVDHTVELLIFGSNIVVVLATLLLTWATLHDAQKSIRGEQANVALLTRLVGKLVGVKSTSSKHRKIAAQVEEIADELDDDEPKLRAV